MAFSEPFVRFCNECAALVPGAVRCEIFGGLRHRLRKVSWNETCAEPVRDKRCLKRFRHMQEVLDAKAMP